VLDNDRAVVFVHAPREIAATAELAGALKARMLALHQKTVDEVYWQFAPAPAAAVTATAHG